MKLSDLLNEKVIKVGLEAREKEEVFEELIDVLVRGGLVSDRDEVREAILDREDKQSTGIGPGVAIPHAKSASVSKLTAALGISKEGIEYDSLDGEPVHIVFLMLADPKSAGAHVSALAQVAMLCKVPGFLDRIVEAGSSKEVYDIIVAEEEREE